MIRLLENINTDIFNSSRALYDFIDYHRNDTAKYVMLNYPTDDKIGYCFVRSITSYNYDMMLYILENYEYIQNSTSYYDYLNYENQHMPAILYSLNEYNFGLMPNWLNIIPSLIMLPFSVDKVMDILKKVPSYIGEPWVNLPKTCLIACFRYKRPYEYINTIVNFIYGSPKIKYNHMNSYRFEYNRWTYFTPLTVLNTLYEKQTDVDIITFIKVMFYKGYDYNKYDLKMIALLMRRKANKNNLKQLTLLMQFYAKQMENNGRE